MSFYTVSADTERIMGTSHHCPDPQKEADAFGCAVYIIEGQPAWLSAEPKDKPSTSPDKKVRASCDEAVRAIIALPFERQNEWIQHFHAGIKRNLAEAEAQLQEWEERLKRDIASTRGSL